jgi:alpha-D-ribose 1-methylphosphonate 5-triphosphate diphosphatase PhnM
VGLFIAGLSKEEPMTILQDAKQSLVAAAKAERERDKTEAMREYQTENRASLANMARLRALRLAKESTESQPQAAQSTAKRKAASKLPSKRPNKRR